MSWLNKINTIFLVSLLFAPVVCVTVVVLNKAPNISSLIITTEEEQEENKVEVEKDNVLTYYSKNNSAIFPSKSKTLFFMYKKNLLLNKLGNVSYPPPQISIVLFGIFSSLFITNLQKGLILKQVLN